MCKIVHAINNNNLYNCLISDWIRTELFVALYLDNQDLTFFFLSEPSGFFTEPREPRTRVHLVSPSSEPWELNFLVLYIWIIWISHFFFIWTLQIFYRTQRTPNQEILRITLISSLKCMTSTQAMHFDIKLSTFILGFMEGSLNG